MNTDKAKRAWFEWLYDHSDTGWIMLLIEPIEGVTPQHGSLSLPGGAELPYSRIRIEPRNPRNHQNLRSTHWGIRATISIGGPFPLEVPWRQLHGILTSDSMFVADSQPLMLSLV